MQVYLMKSECYLYKYVVAVTVVLQALVRTLKRYANVLVVYTQLYTHWTVLHVFLVPMKTKQPPTDSGEKSWLQEAKTCFTELLLCF